jgi:hypothetical protein
LRTSIDYSEGKDLGLNKKVDFYRGITSPPDILETKDTRKQVEERNLENKSLGWNFGRIGAHKSSGMTKWSPFIASERGLEVLNGWRRSRGIEKTEENASKTCTLVAPKGGTSSKPTCGDARELKLTDLTGR